MIFEDKYIIGIGGLAKSGKDTLCNILRGELEKMHVKTLRLALADELKLNIRDSLIEQFGIDILNCTPEEKEIVRPALVAYGKEKRLASRGTYWTKILDEKIKNAPESVIIVPDIRYTQYENDELWWLKEKRKGLFIHVSRYTLAEGQERIYLLPPNEDEAQNDPILRSEADFSLCWKTNDVKKLLEIYQQFFHSVMAHITNELQRRKRRADCRKDYQR